jgi:spectinomycin phosphotransferase
MDVDRAQVAELLRREYGITSTSISDAPRGFVAETFDVRAAGGRRYFVKILPLWADAAAALHGLPVLEELHALGLDMLSHPVRTRTGSLSAALHTRPLIVFDFVEGQSGRLVGFDFDQYVALFASIHQATPLVKARIPSEQFHLPWADKFERVFGRVLREPPSTPPQRATRDLMQHHREQIDRDWATLLTLSQSCQQVVWTPLVTHGDGLGDNLLVGADGRLHLIDWDALLLAPAERDTWFFLNDEAEATAFLSRYRHAFPAYQPDSILYRFYLFNRFFEDLLGYLVNIVESPSPEQQQWNLTELEETCFRWLWPPMRRTDASAQRTHDPASPLQHDGAGARVEESGRRA